MNSVARRPACADVGRGRRGCAAAGRRAQQQPQPQQPTASRPQPAVFRAGINFVRVDVIVSDKNGANVADLKQTDFEVIEDGKPQTVETFKFIKLDGGTMPAPTARRARSAPTKTKKREAARDDVRLFAIFLDDYHVRKENSMRVARSARAVRRDAARAVRHDRPDVSARVDVSTCG